MSQSDSRDVDVVALRHAGEVVDSNACQDATKSLLLRIPAHQALELTQRQVASRWSLFERHQPGVTWPLEFIEDSARIGMKDGLVWPDDDDFTGPGANNFIRAVKHLWDASRILDDDEERVTALVDSIANVIMAERLETWGARHLEQWSRWYQVRMEGKRRVESQRLQREMVLGTESVDVGRRAWLELADVLEKALLHPGAMPP
ncbi:hypothetical protein JQX13_19475 [Archangium violaceum]|uniref:hypothetical protein n=1 Tax=Archangium violaceum TaxID=83451 RepID=UPI00193BC9E3|nr:hypothetical protein [Archangium violaceum]QRK12028.1 hypothetical protein JQX13_19475 [Archangium violaceum]